MDDTEVSWWLEAEASPDVQMPRPGGRTQWQFVARVAGFLGVAATVAVAGWSSSTSRSPWLTASVAGNSMSAFTIVQPVSSATDNVKLLKYAESMFSASTAEAFAMFAKTSYCGPLPGVSAALDVSCGQEQDSACSTAGFRIYPNSVRTFSVADHETPNSLFGFVALVQPLANNATVSSGVVISIRGSIEEYSNSIRDKQTQVVRGLLGCKDCGVHKGYHISYQKLKPHLDLALANLGCTPSWCRIYVTGHGSGAALGSIIAWELFARNYSIGTSYLFSAPRVGDGTFAKRMGETFMGEKEEPIFHVIYGKDSAPRWPFNATFTPWGFEAYFAAASENRKPSAAMRPSQICLAGREDCGIGRIAKQALTHLDMCRNPLAENGTICTFVSYMSTCHYGQGFQAIRKLPEYLLGPAQPLENSAASWHPAEQDGKQALAVVQDENVQDYYNLPTLQAFSALVKLGYCPLTASLMKAVPNSCSRTSGNRCGNAGFGVVAGTVIPRTVNGSLFFYTALIRRRTAEFAKEPYFMPSEACVLIIRGTVNNENMQMNGDIQQVPLNDANCPGCTVSRGIQTAWQGHLEPAVLAALKRSGCEAKATKSERVDRVIIAGHSMGGTMGALALYWLQKRGFDVQLSWMMEGGRPGNPAFMTYLNEKIVAGTRPLAFWLTTHGRDSVPRFPASVYANGLAGRAQFMVHFPSNSLNHTFCVTKESMSKASTCGIYESSRASLTSWRDADHCGLPFAPGGEICHPSIPQCLFGL